MTPNIQLKSEKTQAVIQMLRLLDAKHPDDFNNPDVWHQADQHPESG